MCKVSFRIFLMSVNNVIYATTKDKTEFLSAYVRYLLCVCIVHNRLIIICDMLSFFEL